RAAELSAAKMADSLTSLFVLALLCGVLMYLGVSGFQTFDSAPGRYGAVFLAVTVFILSGFEHCIANMYYYSMSGVWGDGRAWLTMLVMVLGNAAGSIIIAEGYRLSQKLLE
ncbi:formate/nitrite transporter family protein, partial [Agathobaculum sp.]|uniref:formate/nitrite transporter family protein n=1 Tax=Agathobaculum sp. TaxID=2048138 RepID=UPI0039A3E007